MLSHFVHKKHTAEVRKCYCHLSIVAAAEKKTFLSLFFQKPSFVGSKTPRYIIMGNIGSTIMAAYGSLFSLLLRVNPSHAGLDAAMFLARSSTCGLSDHTMGNVASASQLSNYSMRNVRVYVADKVQELDAFIISKSGGDEEMVKSLSELPGGKKFHFKEDVRCVRVLASETKEVPWEAHQVLSVFVEDEDDEKICCRQIVHNMALSAPVTVLLYDV